MKQFLKLKDLKTLLIDDNVIIRDTMQMFFSQKKCFLKTCETAEEGLQALEEEPYDILICDFQLPGIDGVEFFRRAAAFHPDPIKILISGYVNESAISEAFDIGVHAFIRKPFSLMAFFEQLVPHVDQRYDRDAHCRDTTEGKPKNPDQPHPAGNEIRGYSQGLVAA
ncbi:MAG: response regulator [Desulfobacterales bacterium]|jgi:CheY-like chemotaxis protein